jgi:hypothetical protein
VRDYLDQASGGFPLWASLGCQRWFAHVSRERTLAGHTGIRARPPQSNYSRRVAHRSPILTAEIADPCAVFGELPRRDDHHSWRRRKRLPAVQSPLSYPPNQNDDQDADYPGRRRWPRARNQVRDAHRREQHERQEKKVRHELIGHQTGRMAPRSLVRLRRVSLRDGSSLLTCREVFTNSWGPPLIPLKSGAVVGAPVGRTSSSPA